MHFALISDTHAPSCIEKAYYHFKGFVEKNPEVHVVAINGDLLGIFSMTKSNLYRNSRIPQEVLNGFLRQTAPRFYKTFKRIGTVTPEMVGLYFMERYDWCIKTLVNFLKIRPCIFNLGNHESEYHFLATSEIPFLTGCDHSVVQKADQTKLFEIYKQFEAKLRHLETSKRFFYIGNKHIVLGDTMVLGIPGKNHATDGGDVLSEIQEEATKKLIHLARGDLHKVKNVLVLNHTQGNYDSELGKFETASHSLKVFLQGLPKHITQRVYVQSHNHWNYTQFMRHGGIHYIMNNAGLHGGIYNLITLEPDNLEVYDVDPNDREIRRVKLCVDFPAGQSREEQMARYYDDVAPIAARRTHPPRGGLFG